MKKWVWFLFIAMFGLGAVDALADEQPSAPVAEIQPKSTVDFGDYQSGTLVKKAWDALAKNDLGAVLAYTNKCISLYSDQASKQQSSLSTYECSSYKSSQLGALNDVAASYYIQAQAYQAANMTDQAREGYKKVVLDYSYGQTWCPQKNGFLKFLKVADASKAKLAKMDGGSYDFGDYTSSQLIQKAWSALAADDLDAVKVYVGKTLELYGGKAKEMEASLSDYVTGSSDKIFKYWALNDVGTGLFILGQAYQNAGNREEAIKAYDRVIKEFTYAQCWNPCGKFWKPAEAAVEKKGMMASGSNWDYGDQSSSQLVDLSWQALAANDVKAVEAYVQKILSLYGAKAKEMQASLKDYATGSNDDIFKYWALNDVGTGLFILGQAYQGAGDKEDAIKAYKRLIAEFSYAQTWDPKGWFWKPAEAAQQKLNALN